MPEIRANVNKIFKGDLRFEVEKLSSNYSSFQIATQMWLKKRWISSLITSGKITQTFTRMEVYLETMHIIICKWMKLKRVQFLGMSYIFGHTLEYMDLLPAEFVQRG